MGLTFEKYKIRIFIWLITKVLKINIPSFKLLSDNSDIKFIILNKNENFLCTFIINSYTESIKKISIQI